MELWDVYDERRRRTGRTHVRGVPLRPGEYHLVVFAWIYNARGEILLTLRDPQKPSYPNTWACTGGSAIRGESSMAAIRREVREETGITFAPEALSLLKSQRERNSFRDIYALHCEQPVESLTMQPGETVAAQWVSLERLEEMIHADEIAAPDAMLYRQVRVQLEELIARARDGGAAWERTPQDAPIRPGRYRHFKGNEYEVLFTARHSETREEMVVYRALYGEYGLWVRPASMWRETVVRNGKRQPRFRFLGDTKGGAE